MTDPRPRSFVFADAGPVLPSPGQIRSHAIRIALAHRRRKDEERGKNFREYDPTLSAWPKRGSRPRKERPTHLTDPSRYVGAASVDPFETLPVNARRLTTLFHMRKCKHAGEPVFNANEAIHYQSLRLVFATGLSDGPLTAALALTMSYAANGGQMDRECNEYSFLAMKHMREALSQPSTKPTPALIGAVLLMLGIEACINNPRYPFRSSV